MTWINCAINPALTPLSCPSALLSTRAIPSRFVSFHCLPLTLIADSSHSSYPLPPPPNVRVTRCSFRFVSFRFVQSVGCVGWVSSRNVRSVISPSIPLHCRCDNQMTRYHTIQCSLHTRHLHPSICASAHHPQVLSFSPPSSPPPHHDETRDVSSIVLDKLLVHFPQSRVFPQKHWKVSCQKKQKLLHASSHLVTSHRLHQSINHPHHFFQTVVVPILPFPFLSFLALLRTLLTVHCLLTAPSFPFCVCNYRQVKWSGGDVATVGGCCWSWNWSWCGARRGMDHWPSIRKWVGMDETHMASISTSTSFRRTNTRRPSIWFQRIIHHLVFLIRSHYPWSFISITLPSSLFLPLAPLFDSSRLILLFVGYSSSHLPFHSDAPPLSSSACTRGQYDTNTECILDGSTSAVGGGGATRWFQRTYTRTMDQTRSRTQLQSWF